MTEPKRPKTRRLQTVAILPSMMTLGNLLCGFAAVFYASRPELLADGSENLVLGNWKPLSVAACLIFIGMLFDAIDGRIARMTGQTSRFGGQLDSMADMVTFGVAPAFIIIQLVGIGTPFFGVDRADNYFDRAVLVIAGIYVACTGLRLARYNVETDESAHDAYMHFKGLPSPGAAGTVASIVLVYQWLAIREAAHIWQEAVGVSMVVLTLLVAVAMVTNLPYIHVMNRYMRGRGRFHYIALGVVVVLLLATIPQLSIAGSFVIYALSAPVARLLRRDKAGDDGEPIDDLDEEDADPPLKFGGD